MFTRRRRRRGPGENPRPFSTAALGVCAPRSPRKRAPSGDSPFRADKPPRHSCRPHPQALGAAPLAPPPRKTPGAKDSPPPRKEGSAPNPAQTARGSEPRSALSALPRGREPPTPGRGCRGAGKRRPRSGTELRQPNASPRARGSPRTLRSPLPPREGNAPSNSEPPPGSGPPTPPPGLGAQGGNPRKRKGSPQRVSGFRGAEREGSPGRESVRSAGSRAASCGAKRSNSQSARGQRRAPRPLRRESGVAPPAGLPRPLRGLPASLPAGVREKLRAHGPGAAAAPAASPRARTARRCPALPRRPRPPRPPRSSWPPRRLSRARSAGRCLPAATLEAWSCR
ncbi:basic salivary proline-rich protein 4-like [Sorex araneus]|uniref:basic salivary proline-rich protein 4-like n=1 Tax=Sorex araneus TaxID=42254 RepID=UPI0024338534|nr:basic salivary proline-rich protein 4-like [Sorex araneus]